MYNLTPLIALYVLTGCIQNSNMSTGEDIKSTSVLIIMPEQKCNKENMGRILTGSGSNTICNSHGLVPNLRCLNL